MNIGLVHTSGYLSGLRVVEDPNMVDLVEDWSACRSRARAERRRKRGFPQRVAYRYVPKKEGLTVGGVLHIHPEVARALRAATELMK